MPANIPEWTQDDRTTRDSCVLPAISRACPVPARCHTKVTGTCGRHCVSHSHFSRALEYLGQGGWHSCLSVALGHAVDAQRSAHHLTTPGASVTAVVDPVASVFKPELNSCVRGRRGLQLLLLVLLPTPCISCHPIACGRLLFLHIDAQTRTAVTPLTTFGRGRSLLAFAVVFAPARRLVCQRMLRACSARSALHMCV